MKFSEFQNKSVRTFRRDNMMMDINHCALGVAGEAGEIIDTIKGTIYYGKALDIENIKEEIGDTLFYLANLASVVGLNLEECATSNINKLAIRFPEGFSEKDAQERKDKQ